MGKRRTPGRRRKGGAGGSVGTKENVGVGKARHGRKCRAEEKRGRRRKCDAGGSTLAFACPGCPRLPHATTRRAFCCPHAGRFAAPHAVFSKCKPRISKHAPRSAAKYAAFCAFLAFGIHLPVPPVFDAELPRFLPFCAPHAAPGLSHSFPHSKKAPPHGTFAVRGRDV